MLPPHPHSRAQRAGMTLAELIISMGMTAMVLGALGSVWYGIGHAWGITGGVQNAGLTGTQAMIRLESQLRRAKYIFQCRNSTAVVTTTDLSSTRNVSTGTVFFWAGDNLNGQSDGAVEIGELGLIEHDPDKARVYVYLAKPWASMDAGQRARAAGVANWADLADSATPGIFKSYDFVQKTVIGEAVSSIQFNVAPATSRARPVVEYVLTVSRPPEDVAFYGSASLRGPTTRPQ